jgi:hypothetical protein
MTKRKPKTVLAWHFVGAALRDGSPIPADGVTLHHDGEIKLCAAGFHASKRLIDAVYFAPAATLCRVEMGGKILHDTDKMVAATRTILWRIDATELLRSFARQCALDVAHLWLPPGMPDNVRKYLEIGDDKLRAAASAAARAAASAAARAAASAAAWDAASAAAWDAAWDAASAAASAAAWDAASAAAWAAASAAARAAAWDAASAAAWDAAWDAASAAASAAAWAAQNDRLEAMAFAAAAKQP